MYFKCKQKQIREWKWRNRALRDAKNADIGEIWQLYANAITKNDDSRGIFAGDLKSTERVIILQRIRLLIVS